MTDRSKIKSGTPRQSNGAATTASAPCSRADGSRPRPAETIDQRVFLAYARDMLAELERLSRNFELAELSDCLGTCKREATRALKSSGPIKPLDL